MKLGIVTLYGLENQGNRLQNYALLKALERHGACVETIACVTAISNKKERIKDVFEKRNGHITLRCRLDRIRKRKFKEFTNRYLNTRLIINESGKIPEKLSEDYDGFVCGSDQVWNPVFWRQNADSKELYNYMLEFAPEVKRFAYAASIGVDVIPPLWRYLFSEKLKQFSFISVREESGGMIVKQLTGKNPSVVLDPTLLLSVDEWNEIRSDKASEVYGNYILLYFLGDKDEEVREYIEHVSETYHLPIIDFFNQKHKDAYCADPGEFIGLIANAKCVFTDSFHASVFSMLYQVPFAVYSRHHSKVKNMNSRIDTLLNTFRLQERKSIFDDNVLFGCDYSNVSNLLKKSRADSEASIDHIIELSGHKERLPTREQSEIYPFAVGARSRNEAVIRKSSSGGIFYHIAHDVLDKGGVVFGAKFDDNFEVIHAECNSSEKLKDFLGSKYVQSSVGDTFHQVHMRLTEGRMVLYSGTPCEIAGLYSYLNKTGDMNKYRNQVLLVDIICHGVPSRKAWREYKNSIGSENAGIRSVNFRNKEKGWKKYNLTFMCNNGKKISKTRRNDPYMSAFLDNYILRPSCYDCKFKIVHRVSDLTIADFWSVEKYVPELFDDKGTSIVIINSPKGDKVFKGLDGLLETKDISLQTCIAVNSPYVQSVSCPQIREDFFVTDDLIGKLVKVTAPTVTEQLHHISGKVKRVLYGY